MIMYFATVLVALLDMYPGTMVIKVLAAVLELMAFCAVFYKAELKQCIFFSMLNYSLLFLTDIFSLLIENILNSKDELYALENPFLLIPMKMIRVFLLFVLRRIWKGNNSYGALSHKEWRKFSMVPVFTIVSMLVMYFCYSGE